jgi:hypothetical protein
MRLLLNVLSYFLKFFSDIVQMLLVLKDVLRYLRVEDPFQSAGKHFCQADILDVRGCANEGNLAKVAHVYTLNVENLFQRPRVDRHYYQ